MQKSVGKIPTENKCESVHSSLNDAATGTQTLYSRTRQDEIRSRRCNLEDHSPVAAPKTSLNAAIHYDNSTSSPNCNHDTTCSNFKQTRFANHVERKSPNSKFDPLVSVHYRKDPLPRRIQRSAWKL
jgi:hypothetical protein